MLLFNTILAFVQFFAFIGYGVTMKHAIFKRKAKKYLPDSVITTKYAESESECSMYCTTIDACLSVNYKVSGVDRGACQLNNNAISENLGLVFDDEFVHLSVVERSLEKKLRPKSCKDILTKSPGAATGLYDISIDNKMVTVYCEMVLNGGGFTFIPKSAVKNGTLPSLASQLFTSHNEVLLYIQKKEGSQTYTLIEQLGKEPRTPLVVLQNTYTGHSITYGEPKNSYMSDYLYLSTSIKISGFLSNNMEVKYTNGGVYPTVTYFAFFPNHRGQAVSTYHAHDLVFETSGFAVDWRNTGKSSGEKLPNDFFFLTEMHYGGGCYTSSDRWIEANGTAIGLR